MLYGLLFVAVIVCAYGVMRAERLLVSSLWLAATSALAAILLYAYGAAEVAVIELSVGAGLVTVLFVFAFSIVGEDSLDNLTLVPRPLVWALILLIAVLLGWFILPVAGVETSGGPGSGGTSFAEVLWEQRGLDVLAQIVLIFSGVLGLLGLLADVKVPFERTMPVPDKPEDPNALPVDSTVAAPAGSDRPRPTEAGAQEAMI